MKKRTKKNEYDKPLNGLLLIALTVGLFIALSFVRWYVTRTAHHYKAMKVEQHTATMNEADSVLNAIMVKWAK
jgi:hypothetical protein